jgi:CRP-like cAMP-binding protein
VAVEPAELAAVPLFDSLSEPEIKELSDWFDLQTAGEGICLAGEGASGYSFFVLADGTAAVTANGTEIATLGPGDFFGEMAILGNGRRLATVTSTSPVKLFVMFGTEFRRLQQVQPAITARIEASVEERLKAFG